MMVIIYCNCINIAEELTHTEAKKKRRVTYCKGTTLKLTHTCLEVAVMMENIIKINHVISGHCLAHRYNRPFAHKRWNVN